MLTDIIIKLHKKFPPFYSSVLKGGVEHEKRASEVNVKRIAPFVHSSQSEKHHIIRQNERRSDWKEKLNGMMMMMIFRSSVLCSVAAAAAASFVERNFQFQFVRSQLSMCELRSLSG